MNLKAKTSLNALMLGGFFLSQELLTNYHAENQSDLVVAPPRHLVGIMDPASVATWLDGMFVTYTGQVVDATFGDSAMFDKTVTGQRPTGRIEKMNGTYLLIRTIDQLSDVEIAGATAGTDYVVGSDGLFAKVGDATYPLTVINPVVVGRGYITDRIMLGLDSASLAGSAPARNNGYSAVILADSLTAFSKSNTFDSTKLKVGQQVVDEFMIDVSAAVVNTLVTVALKQDTTVVWSESGLIDPLYTGDVLSGRIVTECRVAGAAGKFISWGRIGCIGEAADKRDVYSGVRGETSVDYSVVAKASQLYLAFSAAGANSAILRSHRTYIR